MRRITVLSLTLAVEGMAVALAVLLGDRLGSPAFGQLRFHWPSAIWGFFASLPLLAGLWFATRAQRPPLELLASDLQRRVRPIFAGCDLVSLAVISAAAGIGEETLFRGVMQTALAGSAGTWVAIGLTSVLFGLLHYISPTYAIYAGLFGAYFGMLLVAFGNLLVPIVAHAAYDLLGLIYLIFIGKSSSATAWGEAGHLELFDPIQGPQ